MGTLKSAAQFFGVLFGLAIVIYLATSIARSEFAWRSVVLILLSGVLASVIYLAIPGDR